MSRSNSVPGDPVSIVITKMPLSIAEKLFGTDINACRRRMRLRSDAEEATRLLKTKRASLGKKVSNRLRAALIIDHLARNSIDTGNSQMYFRVSLSLDDLAAMAGVNKKQVAHPQRILNSYLESTEVVKKKQTAMKRKMGETSVSGRRDSEARNYAHDSYSRLRDTSLINSLSIQLAAYICDADFVSTVSSRILSELIQSGGSSSARATKRHRFTRKQLLLDIDKHMECYQAVCFYLAVKKSEGSVDNPSSVSKKPSKSGAQESLNGEEIDEESTSSLSKAMVIQTANLLQNEFNTVLEFVSEWMQELPMDLTRDIGGSGGGSAKSFPIFRTEAATTRTQTSEFEMWRDKVLGDVKKSTLAKMNDKDNGVQERWLNVAADEVLQQLQQRKT